MTKRESFVEILKYVSENEELVNFVNAQIVALDKRAASAKENRQKKSAATDSMSDAIAELVGDEAMTIDEIVAALGADYTDITNAKVSFRANALTTDGILEKSTKVVDKRTLVAYKHK